jgi:hypothetical protein
VLDNADEGFAASYLSASCRRFTVKHRLSSRCRSSRSQRPEQGLGYPLFGAPLVLAPRESGAERQCKLQVKELGGSDLVPLTLVPLNRQLIVDTERLMSRCSASARKGTIGACRSSTVRATSRRPASGAQVHKRSPRPANLQGAAARERDADKSSKVGAGPARGLAHDPDGDGLSPDGGKRLAARRSSTCIVSSATAGKGEGEAKASGLERRQGQVPGRLYAPVSPKHVQVTHLTVRAADIVRPGRGWHGRARVRTTSYVGQTRVGLGEEDQQWRPCTWRVRRNAQTPQ